MPGQIPSRSDILYQRFTNLLAIVADLLNTFKGKVEVIITDMVATGRLNFIHNKATGLQGGIETDEGGEFYHLTLVERDNIAGIADKEDSANKSIDPQDADSDVKFPVWSAIKLWVTTNFVSIADYQSGGGSGGSGGGSSGGTITVYMEPVIDDWNEDVAYDTEENKVPGFLTLDEVDGFDVGDIVFIEVAYE